MLEDHTAFRFLLALAVLALAIVLFRLSKRLLGLTYSLFSSTVPLLPLRESLIEEKASKGP